MIQYAAFRRILLGLVLGFSFCACAIVLYILYIWNPGFLIRRQINWTVEHVEQLINSEIARNSNRKDVESWLDKHDISYNTFLVKKGDDYDATLAAEKAGLRKEDFRMWVRGTIFDAEEDLFDKVEIRIYFFFDDQDRLIKHFIGWKSVGL